MYGQSIVKLFVSQGDSMTLAVMASLEEQGLYAMVSNYGSIIARVLLQPTEESSRTAFGTILASSQLTMVDVVRSKIYLCKIVHLYLFASALAITIGPLVASGLFKLMLGSRWDPSIYYIVSAYCYYIPVLALNGITEAFVSTTAGRLQLQTQGLWLILCSITFFATSYILLEVGHYGVKGIIWANIISMCMRCTWSYRYIKKYFTHYHCQLDRSNYGVESETLVIVILASPFISKLRYFLEEGTYGYIQILTIALSFSFLL